MRHIPGFGILLFFLIEGSASQEFNITPITTSSGLYYEKIGDVLLSNSNWEFVTSVDYGGYLLFYQYLQNQAEKLHGFCQEYQSKYCEERFTQIRIGLNRIEETDENMANFLGIKVENRRVKRFWKEVGNFFRSAGSFIVGGVRSIFGGGGGNVDLSAYDRQIGDLQSGQREIENKLNQQTTLFLVDSERKASQIQWLEKTQGDLQNKIGSLESDFHKDSEEKQKQLNGLKNMLAETNTRLEKQEKAQKKLESDVEEIQNKLLKVDEELKTINENVAKNKESIDELELKVKLNSLSIDFTFLMTQFETEQKKLFTVIKNAKKGDLDPYILTPLNLIQMLQDIQPSLTEGRQFPFYPNLENAAQLYNIITPDVYLFNYTIIFIMKIPLVDYRKFNIHKITSMPIPVSSNKFAFILPQEPFLLVDNNDQEFMLISQREFKDFCQETSKNRYFCKQTQHVSSVYSSKVCEIKLFTTATKIPDSCDKRKLVLEEPTFLQLQKQRSWIYVVPEDKSIIITCGSSRHTIALKGTGFISFAENCMARTSDFILVPLAEFTKPVLSDFSPSMNLTSFLDLSDVDNWEAPKNQRHKDVVLPFDFDQLDKISFPILYERSSLTWLYYILAVLILLIAAAACLYFYLDRNHLTDYYTRRIVEFFALLNPRPATVDERMESGDTGDDRLKLKVKLNRKDEKITRVSIHEHQSSSDPEAEYLTVRFKVKKDDAGTSKALTDYSENMNDVEDEALPIYGNIGSIMPRDDPHLKQLRQLKPAHFR
nr:uncharacterized protein LOC111510369 isoform X1 [Leptinotarsa decemlineata]